MCCSKCILHLAARPDVLKKTQQNHLLSMAIETKFTVLTSFYFALPHICLLKKQHPFGSNGSAQVGITA